MTESPAKYFSLAEDEVPAPKSVNTAEWDGSTWRPVAADSTSTPTTIARMVAVPLMWLGFCVALVCIACSWWSAKVIAPQLEALRRDMAVFEKRHVEQMQSSALASSQIRALHAELEELQQRYNALDAAFRDRLTNFSDTSARTLRQVPVQKARSPSSQSSQRGDSRSSLIHSESDAAPWPPPIRVQQPSGGATVEAGSLVGSGAVAINAVGGVTISSDKPSDIEFVCQRTGRSEWTQVKDLTIHQLGTRAAGIDVQTEASLRSLLDRAMQRLQDVHGFVNECTMGRLCMSVLATLTGDAEARSLHAAPALQTPLLAILLETPWSVIIASGWPLFALLAQLQLQTHGNDDLPPEGREGKYFKGIWDNLRVSGPTPLANLASLGAKFLEGGQKQRSSGNHNEAVNENEAELFGSHAMPILCALSSQLLGPELRGGGSSADEALGQVQSLYRQSVQSIEDLHASVISAWPLYSVLHVIAVHLSGGNE